MKPFSTILAVLILSAVAASGQWPQSSSIFYKDKGVITPAPVSQTLSGGTYNEGSSFFVKCAVNVTAGRVYHFTLTTTGSKPSSNCLRLLNNACCGSATNYASNTGAAATITWTATLTGTIYVCMIDNSNCSQLFGALGTESVTLNYYYTCDGAATPTVSVANNCGNSVLTITNPASGAAFLWSDSGTDNPHTVTTSGAKTVTQTLNGCTTASGSGTAAPLSVPSSNISSTTNVSCNGGNNGSATVSTTGSTTPYTYLWSTGATTQTASSLGAGTYSVTVTGHNGCTTSASATITEPSVLSTSISASANVSCNGGSNGSATVSASGGTTAYAYLWSNSVATQTASSLNAGTYSVTVTDALGCTSASSVTITQPSALAANISSSVNVNCNGGADGSATVTASGGTETYTYLWSNGATISSVSGLSASTYTVTVTDANGCTNTQNTSISEPTAIGIPVTISQYSGFNISINGSSDGSIAPDPYGGTTSGFGMSGYRYSWSTGATTRLVSSLIAGIYSLTVSDAHNCTATGTYTLTEPTAMVLDTIISPVLNGGYNLSCHNGSDGSVHIAVHGAVPPYSFQWSNGAFTQDVSGLTAGNYMLRIIDYNGAQIDTNITLTQPDAITILITPSNYPNGYNLSDFGSNDGALAATVSGGIPSYSYQWVNVNNGTTVGIVSSVSGLPAGLYTLTATDANGCAVDKSKWLFQPTYGGSWDIKGNTLTDPDSNYLGTKDSFDFVMRTNGIERMRLGADGDMQMASLRTMSSDSIGNNLMTIDNNGVLQKSVFVMGHLAAQGNFPEIISFGRGPTLPPLSVSCGIPRLNTTHQFEGGTIQIYNDLGSNRYNIMEIGDDGSNSIIEATASDPSPDYRLLINTYCGKDVFVGNSNSGNLVANRLLKVGGPDFELGISGSRGNHSGGQYRALVHSDHTSGPFDDQLVINYGGDFTGGVMINGGANHGILMNGKVGIGISSTSNWNGNYNLYVKNGIRTESIKVDIASLGGWGDFVFDKDYELKSLKDLESFVKENRHLPGIPSAEEVKREGLDLGDMQNKLLQKIEELTLYVIDLQKKYDQLQSQLINSSKK